MRLLSLFLSLLHHPLILTVCLCMTACRLSFFFFPWPVFSLLFSASPSFSFSFSPPLSSKTIKVRVIDDEEYEKNKSFFLEIGEPQLAETNEKKGGGRGLSLRRKSHIQHTHTHTEHQSTWNLLCSGSSSGSTTGQTTPSTALRPAPRVCLLVCVCVCIMHALFQPPSCCLVSAGRRYQSGFSIERNTISNAAFA